MNKFSIFDADSRNDFHFCLSCKDFAKNKKMNFQYFNECNEKFIANSYKVFP